MKKILIGLTLLLLTSVMFNVWLSCGKPKNCRKFCYDFSGTRLEGMINGSLLRDMSADYADDIGKRFIDGTKDLDALSMTFDLIKLKTLIWQMDSNACANSCDPKVITGIRFYYVKYPSTLGTPDEPGALHGISSEERNKHALVMVPAYWNNVDKKWYDYNIWRRGRCFSHFGTDSLTASLPVGVIAKTGDGDEGDNHGGVGPPPDPGTFPSNPNP